MRRVQLETIIQERDGPSVIKHVSCLQSFTLVEPSRHYVYQHLANEETEAQQKLANLPEGPRADDGCTQ